MQTLLFLATFLLSLLLASSMPLEPSYMAKALSNCFLSTGCIGLPRHCELTDGCEALFTYKLINETDAHLVIIAMKSDLDERVEGTRTNVSLIVNENSHVFLGHFQKKCVLMVDSNNSTEMVNVFDADEDELSFRCALKTSFDLDNKDLYSNKDCIDLKKRNVHIHMNQELDAIVVSNVNLSRTNVVVGMDKFGDHVTRGHAVLMTLVYMAALPSALLITDVGRVYWPLLTAVTVMALFGNALLFPHLSLWHMLTAILRLSPHAILGILASLLTSVYVLLKIRGQNENYVGHLALVCGLGTLFTTGKLATAHFVPTEAFETLVIIFGSLTLLFMAVEANLRREMEEDEKNENIGHVRIAVMIVAGFFVWIVAGVSAVLLGLADEGKDEWFGDHVNNDHGDINLELGKNAF